MNTIILIGNLGKDPDMSYTTNGVAVTKFSLAVSRNEKTSSGEWQKETDWYNITAWGRDAETCNNYLKKGNKVYIEGRLALRKYKDRNNVERFSPDVTLSRMELLTPREQTPAAGYVGGSAEDDGLGDLDEHPF
jgi:single-strand DNA-binding protein